MKTLANVSQLSLTPTQLLHRYAMWLLSSIINKRNACLVLMDAFRVLHAILALNADLNTITILKPVCVIKYVVTESVSL